MAIILGLDVSERKTGFCVLDTDAPFCEFVDKGRLYTTRSDGFVTLRLIKQQRQIKELMEKYSVEFVSMEAPYFEGRESEMLFAMNQFLHQVFYEKRTYVVAFAPQQLKSLSIPNRDPKTEIGKAQMVLVAQEKFNLEGEVLTDDEADAMLVGYLGKIFYQWKFEKKISNEELEGIGNVLYPEAGNKKSVIINQEYSESLGPKIFKAFAGKHTYSRGVKAGTTEFKGIVYRENELFWDYKKIVERQKVV